MLAFDSDLHYYPKQLFLDNLHRNSNAREFRVIRKFFKADDSAISSRLYAQFLLEFLLISQTGGLDLEQERLQQRAGLIVSMFLSTGVDRRRTVHDVYADLYRGDLFEWLLSVRSQGN